MKFPSLFQELQDIAVPKPGWDGASTELARFWAAKPNVLALFEVGCRSGVDGTCFLGRVDLERFVRVSPVLNISTAATQKRRAEPRRSADEFADLNRAERLHLGDDHFSSETPMAEHEGPHIARRSPPASA
jgi:hypothetical protein